MKIHPDKTRSYVQCKHCPDLQLTPNHILECPTVATKLLKMGMVPLRDSLWELLYSPDAPRIAEAVIKTFDGIYSPPGDYKCSMYFSNIFLWKIITPILEMSSLNFWRKRMLIYSF
ncbi:hypothetical protein TNCV_3799411 [Trichonephila clavipes]|nr:hypothetical protein TNCV_3799411 [Trichonephila clavipes]